MIWTLWGVHPESDSQWVEAPMEESQEAAWAKTPDHDGYCDFPASNLKLIIAGSRTITISEDGIMLKLYEEGLYPAEIVSGTARGMDKSGERFAIKNGLFIKRFPADWDGLGRGAGHIRNQQMAEYADALLLIWNGKSKGSASMKRYMEKLGKPVYEIVI